MKKFAIYLPQFHEIEENNKWWGEGFTEWTNVKNASPLFKGHIQPKHPLNGYYNLLEKKVVEEQTRLLHKYGIDGFIYYHYYFCGKKIMEKPAENLLKWKDINQKFFFCWANHTWTKGKGKEQKILIEQKYGDVDEWREHYVYLSRFFRDERYEKIKNKPILMIYVSDFTEKKRMISLFDEWARKDGFNGIYIIETYTGDLSNKSMHKFKETITEQSEMIYLREPNVSTSIYQYRYPIKRLFAKIMREKEMPNKFRRVTIIDGKVLYNIMEKYVKYKESDFKIAHGIFFEWDNTPRHKKRGYVITPPSKKHFMNYLDLVKDDEYVFINAWNEWAEGMMLEPTKENGYKYLEWIKEWSDRNENRVNGI